MSRTQGRLDADFPYHDGHFFIPILPTHNTNNSTTPQTVLTRNGSGDVGLGIVASKTYQFMIPLGPFLFRTGVQDYLQEQFGSLAAGGSIGPNVGEGGAQGLRVPGQYTYLTSSVTAGAAVSMPVKTSANFTVGQQITIDVSTSQEFATILAIADATHITANLAKNHSSGAQITGNAFTTPAGVTGPPPFTGITQLTPVTSPRPKGIKFLGIYPWYQIGGAAWTSSTIGLTQLTALNNAANAEVDIIALAQNGIVLTTQANPYLTPIPVPKANQAWQTTKFTEYVVEWNIVTPAATTGTVYGVFVDCQFNFN